MNVHADFVAVLFIVWGALTVLVGLSTLALGIGAASLVSPDGGGGVGAGLTAAAFTALAAIAILWGAGHIAIGVPLRRRRPWARMLALLAGSLDMILLPYGTALGCYALWVLLREDGKALFLRYP